jgi:phosphoserine phosphatase RsbU/P
MDQPLSIDAALILDSLGDAVYVTDVNRTFIYWNRAAERITGWRSEDMLGRSCYDGLLAHVDKDGHQMCGQEHCPLHRAIVTGASNTCPLAFARKRDGQRIPVEMSVAPIRDASGAVIGGVEVFRDLSRVIRDLQKAQAIQSASLEHDLPQDPRIQFSSHYMPRDIVGGDYYGIRQIDADRYGVFLADVMGHGIAAALYTMHLSALWDRYYRLLARPSAFATKMSNELNRLVRGGEAFAAGMCGLIDVGRGECALAGAGNPPALLIRTDGEIQQVACPGHPLGLLQDDSYDSVRFALQPGDRLLLYSDGAVDIHNDDNKLLGVDGLIDILKGLGYPQAGIPLAAIEEALLTYSNAIRPDDDLTLLEIRVTPPQGSR